MTDSEILLHVAMLDGPGISSEAYGKLIRRWGSLCAALEAGRMALAEELGVLPPMVEPIVRLPEALPRARVLMEQLEERGVRVLVATDPAFPARMARHPEHPVVLYHLGERCNLEERAIAIVGSRQASEAGRWLAFEIAREAAERGFAVVSGLAPGVDSAAHRGALEGGGATIAVLPHGILRLDERRSCRPLFAAADGSAAFTGISQFHPHAEFTAERALARNWTIAALGEAVVVVEARRSGGSHRTARDARALGVPLFVVRWQEQGELNDGNRILLERGGIPLSAELGPGEMVARITGAL